MLLKSTFRKSIAILIFISSNMFSQEYTRATIDSLYIQENNRLNTVAKYKEAIQFNEKMIKESEKIDYKKGVSTGYFYIGSLFSTLGRYEESLKYLDQAKEISNDIQDNYLKASILLEYSRNYQQLGLYNQAITTSNKSLQMAYNINKKYDRETILLYGYSALMSNYYAINVPDSAYYYLHKSFKVEMSAYNLSALAYHHLNYTKNNDSVEYYLRNSQKVLDHQSELVFEKAIVENLWGDYYVKKQNYKQALQHYFLAIPHAKKSQATSEIANSYIGISNTYQSLGDFKKSKEFLEKYSNYKDSIAENDKKIMDLSLQMIINEKEIAIENSRKQLMMAIGMVALLSLSVLVFFARRYFAQNKKMTETMQEEHNRLKENEKETNDLKQTINPAFNEVVELAKNNSPEFSTRFKEVYPEFCKKLLKINPDLQAADLRFCALISLNFSTKDIAEYHSVSPRSVQSKKYRIRKKLNMDSDEDIYLFMSNLMIE